MERGVFDTFEFHLMHPYATLTFPHPESLLPFRIDAAIPQVDTDMNLKPFRSGFD